MPPKAPASDRARRGYQWQLDSRGSLSHLIRPCSPPTMSSEAITLEETNRIRAELGLKPIGGVAQQQGVGEGDAGQLDEDPDAVAARNFQERMESEARDRREK